MSCCEHCPLPKSPEEAEDQAFALAKRALSAKRGREVVTKAIRGRSWVTTTTVFNRYGSPRFQNPTTPDPDRPRGL
jgi:hypothetical protein